jgi:hypothetical protein
MVVRQSAAVLADAVFARESFAAAMGGSTTSS